jgi:hypothetical protein
MKNQSCLTLARFGKQPVQSFAAGLSYCISGAISEVDFSRCFAGLAWEKSARWPAFMARIARVFPA